MTKKVLFMIEREKKTETKGIINIYKNDKLVASYVDMYNDYGESIYKEEDILLDFVKSTNPNKSKTEKHNMYWTKDYLLNRYNEEIQNLTDMYGEESVEDLVHDYDNDVRFRAGKYFHRGFTAEDFLQKRCPIKNLEVLKEVAEYNHASLIDLLIYEAMLNAVI